MNRKRGAKREDRFPRGKRVSDPSATERRRRYDNLEKTTAGRDGRIFVTNRP